MAGSEEEKRKEEVKVFKLILRKRLGQLIVSIFL